MTNNWRWQWDRFFDDAGFVDQDLALFKQWIYPNTMETFRGKTVLDCGCGRGQHMAFVAVRATCHRAGP